MVHRLLLIVGWVDRITSVEKTNVFYRKTIALPIRSLDLFTQLISTQPTRAIRAIPAFTSVIQSYRIYAQDSVYTTKQIHRNGQKEVLRTRRFYQRILPLAKGELEGIGWREPENFPISYIYVKHIMVCVGLSSVFQRL